MRKLGINAQDLLGNDIFKNMELIKKAGFQSVFFYWDDDTDIEKYMEKANELGLEVEALHAPFNTVNTVWVEGDDGDVYTEKMRRCIITAAKYNIPVVILHTSSGNEVPKTSPIGLLRHKKLIIEAERRGVKIAFENTRIIRHLSLLLEYYKSENVGFCYDTGHEKCYTPGYRFMPLFGNRTIFTHIHDNKGLAETKDISARDDLHRIPFDGIIDFERVCKEIRESGYQGTLTLEVNNREPYCYYKDLTAEEFYKKAFAAAEKLRAMIDGGK